MTFQIKSQIKRTNRLGIWTILMAAALGGCASQAPSIAHVHIGHAITGASNTPDQAGYLVVAEERAREAVSAADDALAGGNDLPTRQAAIRRVNDITNTRDDFALVNAVSEAASHIEFAANSPDASANVKAASREFNAGIDGIIERSELIGLYVLDAERARSAAGLAASVHHRRAGCGRLLVGAGGDGTPPKSRVLRR